MKVKTADLIGPALDWAVAQCEGFKKIRSMPAWSNEHGAHGWPQVMVSNKEDSSFDYRPSTAWSQGGPIIQREGIELMCGLTEDMAARFKNANPHWSAFPFGRPDVRNKRYPGPTPLIAALRCFVVSRLGDEIDVPDELV